MREHGRGKRWLLLRRWKTVRGSKRVELQTLFAANRRLFKAYVLREQLDRLWTYKTRPGVLNFLVGWFKALRWQRLPEMEQLGDFLLKHIEGIAAYCDHPVRFGVVESINTTIKGVLRRARGMRDKEMLLLGPPPTPFGRLERTEDGKTKPKFEYRLLASKKTSTMQKELAEAGDQGFGFVGMTVAKTLVGGDEVVSILRRKIQ
jgi:hypothetical protein